MLRTAKVAEHLEVASVVEGVANGLVRFEVGHSQILEVMAKKRCTRQKCNGRLRSTKESTKERLHSFMAK